MVSENKDPNALGFEMIKDANLLKSFNVVSNLNVSCRLHPVVVFTILDAYVRRPQGASRAIGTLLGYCSEGNVVEITDAFAVVHQDKDSGVLMDQDYHRNMVNLRKQVAPKEQVVGWFSTGNEIMDGSVVIHNFYLKSNESFFQPSIMLPSPIHLMIDTELTTGSLSIKAYMNKDTLIAESLVQFHEIPLRVETLQSERSGIQMLLNARQEEQASKDVSEMDAFKNALQQLKGLFKKCQEYVAEVKSGKREGDANIGRALMKVLSSEPFFDLEQFEELCANSVQDTLMVVYLSNLTRTQITLAEKINSAYALN